MRFWSIDWSWQETASDSTQAYEVWFDILLNRLEDLRQFRSPFLKVETLFASMYIAVSQISWNRDNIQISNSHTHCRRCGRLSERQRLMKWNTMILNSIFSTRKLCDCDVLYDCDKERAHTTLPCSLALIKAALKSYRPIFCSHMRSHGLIKKLTGQMQLSQRLKIFSTTTTCQ